MAGKKKAAPRKTHIRKPKWIEVLERQLARDEASVHRTSSAKNTKRSELNKTLLEDFWRLWLRFHGLGVVMAMQPAPTSFLRFTLYPDEWQLKADIDFGGIETVALVDTTPTRVGDSLIANYYTAGGESRLRLVFEFIEGEKYHRYAGWKRHVSQYTLCDLPLSTLKTAALLKVLGDVVRVWYTSYLKRNRKLLLESIKKKYRQAETFIR